MKEQKSYFRRAVAESPISVYYFTPSHIDQKPQPLHRSHAFLLLQMRAGEVEFYTTGGRVLLTAGDICLVPNQMLHAFRTTSLQTNYIHLGMHPGLFALPASHFFMREFWKPLQNGTLKLPQVLRPNDTGHREVMAQLDRLTVEKEGTDGYTMELMSIAMNICAILYPLCTCSDAPEKLPSEKQSVSDQCLHYIQQHYRQRITLQDIAGYVHLHPNYLCALFREQTGKTVFEQLNWVRTHEASKLLRSTELPVSQIATQCGFQNPNFFARKFKQLLGRSPTDYRNLNRAGKP